MWSKDELVEKQERFWGSSLPRDRLRLRRVMLSACIQKLGAVGVKQRETGFRHRSRRSRGVTGVQPTYGENAPFTENSRVASPVGARLSLRLRVRR